MEINRAEVGFIEKKNAKFFSNDLVLLGSETCERISSPANHREGEQDLFTVPTHTVGSKNLFIYVSGRLLIPNVDYEDINSEEVRLNTPINSNQSFDAILVAGVEAGGGSGGGGEVIVVENHWEDF